MTSGAEARSSHLDEAAHLPLPDADGAGGAAAVGDDLDEADAQVFPGDDGGLAGGQRELLSGIGLDIPARPRAGGQDKPQGYHEEQRRSLYHQPTSII